MKRSKDLPAIFAPFTVPIMFCQPPTIYQPLATHLPVSWLFINHFPTSYQSLTSFRDTNPLYQSPFINHFLMIYWACLNHVLHSAGSLNQSTKVASIYSLDYSPVVWQNIQALNSGGSYVADDLRPDSWCSWLQLVTVWMKSSLKIQLENVQLQLSKFRWRQSHLHQPLHRCELRWCTAENRLLGRSRVEKTRPQPSAKWGCFMDGGWV